MKVGGYLPGGMLGYGNASDGRRINKAITSSLEHTGNTQTEEIRVKKRMLEGGRGLETTDANGKKVFQSASEQNSMNSMQTYTESLKASRKKTKESSLQVKHIRYQVKAISSQIVKSKTSTNCRQVVGKARREVIRLKRLRSDEDYDAEELQAAITHAQSMERVAKKKLNHLLQEEMIKVKEEGAVDVQGKEIEIDGEDETLKQNEQGTPSAAQEEFPSKEVDSQGIFQMDQMLDALEELEGDPTEDMMRELQDSLQEMLREMGVSDLTESLAGPPKMEMDEREFKDYQRKHRLAEMKELIKADGEYLKARFEQLQRAAANGMGGVNGVSVGSVGFADMGGISFADPGVTCGGSIDFSI